MGRFRPLFVYFRLFHIALHFNKLMKYRWCACDSNLGRQDGRHRWINWASYCGTPQGLKKVFKDNFHFRKNRLEQDSNPWPHSTGVNAITITTRRLVSVCLVHLCRVHHFGRVAPLGVVTKAADVNVTLMMGRKTIQSLFMFNEAINSASFEMRHLWKWSLSKIGTTHFANKIVMMMLSTYGNREKMS